MQFEEVCGKIDMILWQNSAEKRADVLYSAYQCRNFAMRRGRRIYIIMVLRSINGVMLRKMILNGAKLLDSNKQHVDSLNVFPVPDGDTGTNMSLTLLSAAKEVTACPNNDISVLCEAISKAATAES